MFRRRFCCGGEWKVASGSSRAETFVSTLIRSAGEGALMSCCGGGRRERTGRRRPVLEVAKRRRGHGPAMGTQPLRTQTCDCSLEFSVAVYELKDRGRADAMSPRGQRISWATGSRGCRFGLDEADGEGDALGRPSPAHQRRRE